MPLLPRRVQGCPLLRCHAVVGESVPVGPDDIGGDCFGAVQTLFGQSISTLLMFASQTSAYSSNYHKEIICREVAKSNSEHPGIETAGNDHQTDSQQAEGFCNEVLDHLCMRRGGHKGVE